MVAPHAFAGAVLLAAALHFVASIPNGLVLEFDQNPNGLRDDLLKEPVRIESDGMIKPQRVRARHRARPLGGRALSQRMTSQTVYTIGYEDAAEGRRRHPRRDRCGDASRRARPADIPAARLFQAAARSRGGGCRNTLPPSSCARHAAGRPPRQPPRGMGPVLAIVEERLASAEAELALQETAEVARAAPSMSCAMRPTGTSAIVGVSLKSSPSATVSHPPPSGLRHERRRRPAVHQR
jgi:hypothetical protein